MRPNLLLIISVLVAAVIIFGAIIVARGSGSDEPKIPDEMQITQEMQQCAEGDGCIVVDQSCGVCCDFVAINSLHEKYFDAMYKNSCKKYSGEVCGCYDLSSYPSCVQGKCEMIKWPE